MINPKEALEDAETHVNIGDEAKQVWLTEAMIRHWQDDALEAAAVACQRILEQDPCAQAAGECAEVVRAMKSRP